VQLHERIRPFSPSFAPESPPQPCPLETQPPDANTQRYPTGLGLLTFEELYAQTDRIVGYTLRERYGMSNPEDIDDCIQAGYVNVWKQLQKQPTLFADKPKKYIVQAVVLRSKAQRYAHLRHYRKVEYDADADAQRALYAPTTHRVDTWIDLESAINTVAHYVTALDTPQHLGALYTLLTDVKTIEVANLFQRGVSTITAAKRQVRATLAHALPHYGNGVDTSKKLNIPIAQRIRPFNPRGKLTVATLLCGEPRPAKASTTEILPPKKPIHVEQAPIGELSVTPSEPTYTTRWRGAVTIEDVLTDQDVRRVAFAKMRAMGYFGEDAEDCFQSGSLKLWQTLREQPTLLSDKGVAWVGIFLAHAGSHRNLWKHKARNVPLDDSIGTLKHNQRTERWAGFATRIDARIDFERMVKTLANRYEQNPLKLFAFYSLLTSVTMKDAGDVIGVPKNMMIQARQEVTAEVQQLMSGDTGEAQADEGWLDRIKQGERLDVVTRIAQRVMENQRLLLALYITTTSATRKDVTDLFGIGLTAFRKETLAIKRMLTQEARQKTQFM
jgi:hypothetical protein